MVQSLHDNAALWAARYMHTLTRCVDIAARYRLLIVYVWQYQQ